MLKPSSLAKAYVLARLQEITIAAIQNNPRPMSKSLPNLSVNSYNKPLTITALVGNHKHPRDLWGMCPVRRWTIKGPRIYATIMMRSTPGHRCKRIQVYMMQLREVLDDQEEEEEVEEAAIEEEAEAEVILVGQLFVNVLWGFGDNITMLIKERYGRNRLCILVDTGSTHNFLNKRVARQLGCKIVEVPGI